MENLISKLFAFIEDELPITLTKDELDCLIRIVELMTQIDLLEYLPEDKELLIEANKKELEDY